MEIVEKLARNGCWVYSARAGIGPADAKGMGAIRGLAFQENGLLIGLHVRCQSLDFNICWGWTARLIAFYARGLLVNQIDCILTMRQRYRSFQGIRLGRKAGDHLTSTAAISAIDGSTNGRKVRKPLIRLADLADV